MLVFKQYSGRTVATAYPTPTKKLPTPLQIARRQQFAKAVAMTRLWLQNPEQKRFLEQLAHKWNSLSAYHAGVKYFMLNQPPVLNQQLPTQKVQRNSMAIQGNPQSTQPLPHGNALKIAQKQAPHHNSAPMPLTRKGRLYASLAGIYD